MPSAGARPFAGWVRVAAEIASDLGFGYAFAVEFAELGLAHASLQMDWILVRGLDATGLSDHHLVSAAVRLP